MQKRKDSISEFDYLGWWKYAVKQENIAPSEAWHLDYIELMTIAELEPTQEQDLSPMVNEQRELNGMIKGEFNGD